MWSWKPRGPMSVQDARGGTLLERVIRSRGLDPASAGTGQFLSPSLVHLHDPSGIPDLDRAAERILAAARNGERVVIYGDYDVDGISATAILFHVVKAIHPGANVSTYVPHRLDEGYGLNAGAIEKLGAEGAKVIVTVDCGITAHVPAETAARAGVDLIITDHHTPPRTIEEMPRAYAVVHPGRPDSAYPFGELCGAGVAFKVAWRMATLACGSEKVTQRMRELLLDMLSLSSLGVIADVVPLLGENRVIARFGLARLRRIENPGLRALIEASGLAGEKVNTEDVGFRLAPRLNACGRMGHAREAVELLTTANPARSREIAAQLTRQNDLRREIEKNVFEQAVEAANAAGMTGTEQRGIVLAHRDWHQGVVGIVCSRLVERFHRPVLLMQDHGEECHGSGRSVEGVNLHRLLERSGSRLMSFGGHDMAAGLKVRTVDLPAFAGAFLDECNRAHPAENLRGTARFDCDAEPRELTTASVRGLECLAPFGRGNPGVTLRLRGLEMVGRPEVFGSHSKHAAIRVRRSNGSSPAGGDGATSSRVLRLYGWNWAERMSAVPPWSKVEALVAPKISTWGGGENVECEIKDIRVPAMA